MTTRQNLIRLESELRSEDLATIKRRRTNNRRDVTRNERYLKDSATQAIENLDSGAIEHHLEKIKANISIAELLQDAILSHLKEDEKESEEEDHHVHHCRMLTIRKGLSEQLSAARVYEQSTLAKETIDACVVQPTITDYGIEAKLKGLNSQLTELQALAHPLKQYPKLSETIQELLKNLATLWKRFNDDNPTPKASIAKDLHPATGISKFDRLPRIELPSFNGKNSEWRPYWEKFTNVLRKDNTLTEVDKLSFLLMTMKNQEGKDIIDSHTRQGPDYDAAVQALKERYDQPRVTSRTIHQNFTGHAWKMTDEGIGKIVTLIQRTVATMKECSVDSLDTLYTVIAELQMPDEFFKYWTERTCDSNKTPTTDRLIELLQQYRLRLQGRTNETPTRPKTSNITSPQPNKKPWKSSTFHVQKERDRQLCHDGNHPLYLCNAFKIESVEERNSIASRMKVCNNCLSPAHFTRDCHSNRSCRECGKKHHSLLHRQRSRPPAMNASAVSDPVNNSVSTHVAPTCNTVQEGTKVFLGTIQVTVEAGGRKQKARALLDGGSPISFITTRMTQRLKARKISEQTNVSGISQSEVPLCRYKVDLKLLPERNRTPVSLRAVVIYTITGQLPDLQLKGVKDKPFLRGLDLADPNFDQPAAIDMLFGLDVLDELLLDGRRSSNDRMIYAQDTIFGWSIRGKYQQEAPSHRIHLCSHSTTSESSTDELLSAFWKAEEPPANFNLETDEENQALDHFARTHSRTEEGRYIVCLPKKNVSLSLGCSRDQAVKRYRQNQHSLERKGSYLDFTKALLEYEEMDHAEPVPAEDLFRPEAEVYYLPAHGVVKESSTSTKLRVVFDASARTTSGTSLNDSLLTGPNLYPMLTNVVLSFRMHPIGMSADISKMFRQVGLHPEGRDLHRFLQSGPDGKLRDMRMTRVTFGVTSSPFLATQVLRQLAKDHQQQYPRASEIVASQFYVDDCLTGASTVEEAAEVRAELNSLLASACMRLCKWRSHSPELLETIPDDMKEKESLHTIAPPDQCHKALGLHWDTRTDSFHVATPTLASTDRPSKRKIASDVARTFDLLDWFAPCTVMIKIQLQQLWKLKIGWDDPVPEQLAHDWKNWRDELELITNHPIPRYPLERGKSLRSLQLHGFSDASNVAYAGVVYIRALYTDSTVSTSLIMAKTKVAPILGSTTPRLELCGAQLLSKIMITVAKALSISIIDLYAWSDSTITLCWLSTSPVKLKAYVCNRVADTIKRVPAKQWRHVPTAENPADVASRGTSPGALIDHSLWWKGPPWLQQSPTEWPASYHWKSHKDQAELKPSVLLTAPPLEDLTIDFTSYSRTKRIFTWCFRFVHNCRQPKEKRILSRKLNLAEIQITENQLLKLTQSRFYKAERRNLASSGEVSKQSSIQRLRPFLDAEGLIRVGGHLEKSALTSKQKHPVILHHSDHLTKLIGRQAHLDNLHVGPTALLGILSLRFHIVGVKQLTKEISRACVRCRKAYARTATQVMGQLPTCRVVPTSPFQHTGADFAGPIKIKRGYTRKPTFIDVYVCVFVCMATKAVHLEMVLNLTTADFLAALRRFVARRGCPETLATDNGSNFVGAQRELQKFHQLLNSNDTQSSVDRFCSIQNINWTLTSAIAALWWSLGGCC